MTDPTGDTATLPSLNESTGDPSANDNSANEYDIDDDFAPRPRRKLGAMGWTLVALLLAGLGFLIGVTTEKHSGTSTTSSAFGGAARAGGGFAEGGNNGFAAGGQPGGNTTNGTTGGTTTGGTSAASTPSVIGTVSSVSGSTIGVTNLGGTKVTVTVTATTTITKALGAADLAVGDTVAVTGTTASDGSVTAINIAITKS